MLSYKITPEKAGIRERPLRADRKDRVSAADIDVRDLLKVKP